MVDKQRLRIFRRAAKNDTCLTPRLRLIPLRRVFLAIPILILTVLNAVSADRILWASPEGSNSIDNVFHARQYGGLYSNDTPVAMALDSSGNVYIAGNTVLRSAGGIGWGTTEPGVYCAGDDIFLASLDADGSLAWVRRFGTAQQDTAHAMVIADDALYVCGTTYGSLIGANQGESDVFISKFSLSGYETWSYQLGSNATDECSAIVVGEGDESGHRIVYIAGTTTGILFEPGAAADDTYRYVARFREKSRQGLRLLEGTQKNTFQTTSTVGLALSSKHLYLLTNTYDAGKAPDPQASSTLELFHRDTLRTHIQPPTTVNPNAGHGFFATKLLVDNTSGEAYIAGLAYSLKEEKSMYYVLKYALQTDSPAGSMNLAWSRSLGMARPSLLEVLGLRFVAMSRDVSRDIVHVTGMVLEYYRDMLDSTKALLMIPLLSITSNGTLVRVVRRWTPYPLDSEEIIDITVDQFGAVLYVGSTISRQCPSSECSGTDTNSIVGARVIFGAYGSENFISNHGSAGRGSWTPETKIAGDTATLYSAAASSGSSSHEKILVSIIAVMGSCGFGAVLLAGILLFGPDKETSGSLYDVESSSEFEFPTSMANRRDDAAYPGMTIPGGLPVKLGGSAEPE